MKRAKVIIIVAIAVITLVGLVGRAKADELNTSNLIDGLQNQRVEQLNLGKLPVVVVGPINPIRPISPIRPINPIGPIIIVDLDADDDGVLDGDDNCIDVENADQDDLDKDGKGDACDEDLDGDGYLNDEDNCLAIPNGNCVDADDKKTLCTYDADGKAIGPNQDDKDLDGVGDACDEDFEGEVDLNESELPTLADDGAGCSLITSASGSGAGMLLILLGLAPVVIRRKRW